MSSSTPADSSSSATFPIPANVFAETVLEVEHYTDRLFRFRTTRPREFRFRSGEFVMIGLPNAQKPIYRAYSLASPSWDEQIEYFSIKVPNGPLTEHLQKVKVGDKILMRKKPTGTLVLDALLPGDHLYMFSTGTGIAPFASLIRDPETYEKFDKVILTQTCREVAELQYGEHLIAQIRADEMLSELVGDKLIFYTTVTREPYPRSERITTLIRSGKLFEDIGMPPFNPAHDRAMICGSMDMLKETRELCEAAGLVEGANNAPGTFVVERAFVD